MVPIRVLTPRVDGRKVLGGHINEYQAAASDAQPTMPAFSNPTGFRPGEPVLTWVTEPSWHTPYCLENGNTTKTGIAQGTAALWYRGAARGRYRLCLVGVASARVACGSFVLAHQPSEGASAADAAKRATAAR